MADQNASTSRASLTHASPCVDPKANSGVSDALKLTDEERARRKKESAAKARAKYNASEKGKAKAKAYNEKYRAENAEKIKPRAREYIRQYRKDNPDKVKASAAAYRASHREEAKRITAQWCKDNPERVKARSKSVYAQNREFSIAKVVEWQKKNPDKVAARAHNYRARKLSGGGRLSKDIVPKLFSEQGGKCCYCDASLLEKGQHLDHVIPLSLGGPNEDWNTQLLCPSCNCTKRDNHPLEFLQRFAPCSPP